MLIIGSCFGKQARGYILGTVYRREEGHYRKLYYDSSKHATRQNSSLIVKYKGLL
jgi:hypothetical protein